MNRSALCSFAGASFDDFGSTGSHADIDQILKILFSPRNSHFHKDYRSRYYVESKDQGDQMRL
jgi:hypothetical protein